MAEVRQLEDLRTAAVEDLARLRLELGEHEALVPDLRRAIADAPWNEQLWGSLILALARSGRRAEAMLAYREAADVLRRELDIEPGPALRRLAAGIRDGSIHDAGRDRVVTGGGAAGVAGPPMAALPATDPVVASAPPAWQERGVSAC
jgi:DNA-binding SARP family transcriptional activator